MRYLLCALLVALMPIGILGPSEALSADVSRPDVRFAVLGDLHYIPPDYKVTAFVHQVAAELKAANPAVDFVCQTGDVVEGGYYTVKDGKRKFVLSDYDAMRDQWIFAINDLARSLPCPLYIAIGNHDKHDPGHRAYREIVLPRIARQLGRPVDQTTYALDHGRSRFVFLDFGAKDLAAQAAFVESQLTQRRSAVDHIFLFCHYPLWEVARPGFERAELTASLEPILRRHPIDAFFCGHTHNTAACVRKVGSQLVAQIQGVATGTGAGWNPFEGRRALLQPRDLLAYLWGYLEGSVSNYYLVDVSGSRVTVQLRVPGEGVIREFAWDQPGAVRDLRQPAASKLIALTAEAIRGARQASLVFCPMAADPIPVRLILNGRPQDVTLKPSYTPFWSEQRVPLTREDIARVGPTNTLRIENPAKKVFALGDIQLRLVLADGDEAATTLDGRFYFSCPEKMASTTERKRSWQSVPAAMRVEVELGQPIEPGPLQFAAPKPRS